MNSNGNYDDTIPMAYLNNENPYAFCSEYHRNSINIPEKKLRLSALQRIQPTRISFRMPLKHVEKEKEYLLDYAIDQEKKALIRKGLSILKIEYHDSPVALFEQYVCNPDILEILIRIKKLNLFFHQKRLRSKVALAISNKITEDVEYNISSKGVLEVDNLKDALVYCKLQDLYGTSNKEQI